MIAAFKMGLYFKLFVTLLLLLRFASHSSQRTYPPAALLRQQHFRHIASAPLSPALRVVVLTDGASPEQLRVLLRSLADADYEADTVALDVWLFASSFCDYFPLPLYPLAMAVFGPPRFDHSIPPVVQSAPWPHGRKTLIAHRSEPDLTKVWESSRGTANESLLFIDASVAKSLSRAYYSWLKRARAAIHRGMIANAGLISLDAVRLPEGVPSSDRAVLLEQLFPATAAFSPTQDVWITFLKWHAMHGCKWFARPRLHARLNVGGYDFVHALRVRPVRAWLAQFLDVYRERVLHPVMAEKQTLLVRHARTTAPRVAGAGVAGRVQLDAQSELEANVFDGTMEHTAVPEQPVVVKWNGMVSTAESAYGVERANTGGGAMEEQQQQQQVRSEQGAAALSSAVRRIGQFARSRGARSVALTVVSEPLLHAAMSWLCNVAVLDIAPRALVLVSSERAVADQLWQFTSAQPRLQQGSLVLALRLDSVHDDEDEQQALTLLRATLMSELLQHGVSVLQFEAEQVWLSDPVPYVQHALSFDACDHGLVEDFRYPDVVLSGGAAHVGRGVLYVRPSVGARQLLSTLVQRLLARRAATATTTTATATRAAAAAGRTQHDLLTALVRGRDAEHGARFPRVKAAWLDAQLFVDGRWFLDFEDEHGRRVRERRFYRSEASLYPVVLSNNGVGSAQERVRRAKRFGLWFVRRERDGGEWSCDEQSVLSAARSGSSKEQREAKVVELGIASQSDTLL